MWPLVVPACCWGATALGQTAASAGGAPTASADAVWQEATRLEADGRFEEAAAQYGAIPTDSPDWQKAAVQAGGCLEKAGKLAEAVARYDAVIARNPSAYWAELALLQKARTCNAMANVAEARRCIDRLKARFPDSSSLAHALLLQAQIDGRNTAAAEALVARELEATALYRQAILADRKKDEAQAFELLDAAITRYPDTPAALRCRDARAHMLVRHRSPEERTRAGTEFLYILTLVEDSAPNSRIAEIARLRLAALHHSFRNRQDAIALYQGLLNSADKAIAGRAALQVAGLQFELMQREKLSGAPPSDRRWEELRALCAGVAGSRDATVAQRVRAEVMAIESLAWQGRDAEALAAVEVFLSKYRDIALKQDVATVHFLAGVTARKLGDYNKALRHFGWVVTAYAGEKEIWPGMDHLPRAHKRYGRFCGASRPRRSTSSKPLPFF
ncbi:MAG: tetratricopeptide repeat protein [Bryobacteraceae bacterium]